MKAIVEEIVVKNSVFQNWSEIHIWAHYSKATENQKQKSFKQLRKSIILITSQQEHRVPERAKRYI